ncbi:MAG TPA: LysR family transcriptional regulator [Phenylobacterium sp.]|jgi:DNA-binding transcriptional LysR family regulator|uniref:LysR family transcriptional regulator n=1 Tax=Phenylobacterium sp. TaxID=1871053 RepID=UPI002D3FAAFC|nr:LysR family transcriptional regulator [Phenylobacterium sp.]HZZ70397.1 LysR family transcriptional regulator [Phenylobacterium sp.]
MPGPNDWDLFQSLHAVLEAGTLSAAARLRGLTQPTLGRHIETLEQRLGSPLFLRSPRGLQPTDLALELKPHLHDMSAAASAAVRDASGAANSLVGSIRITVSEIVGVEVLPPMLTSFREQHPGVVIELKLSNINDDLSRREADIAVRMTPPSQSSLIAKKVGEVTLGFFASAEYLERHGAPETLADLKDHTVVGFDSAARGMRDVPGLNMPVSREVFTFRSDSDLAQLAAVRAGFGIGVAQTGLGRRHGLVRVMPEFDFFHLGCWIVMHENLRGSRRMRLMFDHLVEHMGAYVRESRAAG